MVLRCSEKSKNSGYFSKNGVSSTRIYSIGSKPTVDLANWADDDSFVPVPISLSIEPMDMLMWQPVWEFTRPKGNIGDIALNPNEPDGKKLNGELIQKFFKKNMEWDQYCTVVLQKRICTIPEEKGCGINSDCSDEQKCKAADNAKGFECVGKIISQKKESTVS